MPLFGEEVLVRIDLPYGNIKQHFFEFVNIFALFRGNEYFGIRYFSAFVALIRRDDTRFSRRKRQDFLVLFRQIFAAVQHDDEHVRLVEHAARKGYAYVFHGVRRIAYARGVLAFKLHAVYDERTLHHVPRGARDVGNDRLIVREQTV